MNRLYSCAASLSLLLVACGSASSSADTDEVPVALDRLPQQFADELCDAIAPCCTAANVAYDATTCKNTASEVYQLFVSTNGDANTKYDAVAARTCLSRLKSVLGTCATLVPDAGGVACDNIFETPVASPGKLGGSPASAETCMGDFYNVSGKY